MATLAQVRTNTSFVMSYKDLTLSPQVELIILFVQPDYKLKGQKVIKDQKLDEFRITTDAEGIMHLIGELQSLQAQLTTMGNMSVGLNSFIAANREAKQENKAGELPL